MERLDPKKLHVKYIGSSSREQLALPRRYTLTHSDFTGELFLFIGSEYNKTETFKLYTRLMRDEVLAELLNNEGGYTYRVYCHVSGGFNFGSAGWRYRIFQRELPLVLEAIRYGDRHLFENNPELDNATIYVHLQSNDKRFNKIENRGIMLDYR